MQTDVIYLDFKKAFDSVQHSLLIEKLCNIDISGNLLNWFVSYLSHRKQSVVVEGSLSSWSEVKSSILGPLMFIVFLNGLSDVLQHTKVALYVC